MLKRITLLLGAYCFVFGFCRYFHGYESLGNQSIFNIFLFLVAVFIGDKAYSIKDKRLLIHGFLFGGFLSVVLVVGKNLYDENSIIGLLSLRGLLKAGITIVGFSAILGAGCSIILRQMDKMEWKLKPIVSRILLNPVWTGMICWIAWMPCYMSYYPGIYSYDMITQTNQALGIEAISRFHPPLHTLFWKMCLGIEGVLGWNALVCYSVVQMLLMAYACGVAISFMAKKGFHRGIVYGSILFFALNPVIAIFSFIPTKDASLAIFVLIYVVHLFDFVMDADAFIKSKKKNIQLIISALLCCLLRNNMIYAIALASVIMMILPIQNRKRIALWAVSIISLFFLINGPVYSLLGIQEGDSKEMLSVPMQQLASVVYYHEDELSPDELDLIGEYLPVEEMDSLYNLRFADDVKGQFNSQNFNESPNTFWSVWLKFFTIYPVEYVDAFLNLNLPYWYPDANTVDEYANRSYIESYIWYYPDLAYKVVRDSKIPWLLELYEKVACFEIMETKPIIVNIFSISTPIWVLLVGGVVMSWKKRMDLYLPFLPAVCLWITYMFGPVSNCRYMYPIMVLYPLYIAFIIMISGKSMSVDS